MYTPNYRFRTGDSELFSFPQPRFRQAELVTRSVLSMSVMGLTLLPHTHPLVGLIVLGPRPQSTAPRAPGRADLAVPRTPADPTRAQ